MRIELRTDLEKLPAGCPADEFQPYIDVFPVDGASSRLGGVLILPGGGYAKRAYHEGDPVARRFNELGYHAFVLQYRVAPYRYPAPQKDVIRAVKLLRSRAFDFDLGKLAVLGFSAGGHLAASSTILADKISADEGDEADRFSGRADAMILCYPVISLTDDFAHKNSGIQLFGEKVSEKEIGKLNMQDLVDENTPPAFLWHTADDEGVPVRNSMEFASRMWEKGKNCELHVFPHGSHGKGLGLGLADICRWTELAGQFLETTAGFARA